MNFVAAELCGAAFPRTMVCVYIIIRVEFVAADGKSGWEGVGIIVCAWFTKISRIHFGRSGRQRRRLLGHIGCLLNGLEGTKWEKIDAICVPLRDISHHGVGALDCSKLGQRQYLKNHMSIKYIKHVIRKAPFSRGTLSPWLNFVLFSYSNRCSSQRTAACTVNETHQQGPWVLPCHEVVDSH